MSDRLTVEPLFGLANRIQVVESALALAVTLDRPFGLIWNLNRELNCRFDDLFVVPPGIASLDQPIRGRFRLYSGPSVRIGTTLAPRTPTPQLTAHGPVSAVGLGGLRRLNWWLLADRQHHRAIYENEMVQLHDAGFDFETLRSCPSVFIRAFLRFYDGQSPAPALWPAPEIEAQIRRQVAMFPKVVVGVHVRRTDHQRSMRISTTERFGAAMREELALEPLTHFFLSTDDPEEESVLGNLFPGRILIRPKRTLDRNDPAAIQDALVDLHCLARTRKVLGSFASSFSRLAARLGGGELVVVGAGADSPQGQGGPIGTRSAVPSAAETPARGGS